ncbi:MAG: four-carbon acid sugar kinase family protein [Mesorhizobium sp.]|uniref:four-carbon acid sugar kinase family protein n=2 Tax=Mesorhizobium sp. TaxID=1871066 RepID=UPI000FD4CFC0|nr:four-carbon acid sugar kinase family protein [Mesorhizobium sp.]RUX99398.1 four-carbon acid sugar kinase family protein [Mesorhizobium sp. M2A.F.Ca.ET.040.01.1.1]RWA79074.1 MAG: four-carbon acid sugar kinase family protein [Mesorhizobium sp.]
MSVRFAVIADDFTGGLFVASNLEKIGIPALYVCDPGILPSIGDQGVVVVATRLRFMPPAEAVATLDSLTVSLDAIGTEHIFYKYCSTFDSTDEGNIGPCADFLIGKYDQSRLVFGPGYPDLRTYVHEGYMFYKDRLISESIKRFDPISPMNDPDMARVLQRQTAEKVGLLPHRVLHRGSTVAHDYVRDQQDKGVRYFLMDCVDNDDVALGAVIFGGDRVTTGADALAIELASRWEKRQLARQDRPMPLRGQGGEAVLVGSCSEVTLRQRDHFALSNPVLDIDIREAEADALTDRALEWARRRLDAGRAIGFSVAGDPDAVTRAQSMFGVMGAARKAEAILAGIARGLAEKGVRKFVVSGGESSGAIVQALGIQCMQVLAFDELGAGSCISQDDRRISLFLKPGKIGAEDVFSAALEKMRA